MQYVYSKNKVLKKAEEKKTVVKKLDTERQKQSQRQRDKRQKVREITVTKTEIQRSFHERKEINYEGKKSRKHLKSNI